METAKQQIHLQKIPVHSKVAVADIAQRFEDGEYGFDEYIGLKHIEKITKGLLSNKAIKSIVTDQGSAYKGQSIHGYQVDIRSTRTTYDFSKCGHPELNQIDALIMQLRERKKLLEDELKMMEAGTTKPIVVQYDWLLEANDSSEMLEVIAPIKSQSEGLVLTEMKMEI